MRERSFYKLTDTQTDAIKNLVPKQDAFFVLSGGVVIKGNRLVSTGFKDFQWFTNDGESLPYFIGGKTRMVAMARIHQAYPNTQIYTLSSGALLNKPNLRDIFSYAPVHHEELVNLGVATQMVLESETSKNTKEELLSIIQIAGDMKQIGIVTDDWQIQRAKTMLELLDTLPDIKNKDEVVCFRQNVAVTFIDSSSVLSEVHSNYNDRFTQRYKKSLPEYQRRLQIEERAINVLRTGNYVPIVGRNT